MPKGNRYRVAGTLKLYVDAARAISQGSNYASTITDTYNSVEGEGTPYIDAFSGYESYHPAIPIWWVPYWGGSGYSIGWINDNYNYQATQPTSNYSSRALGSALTLTFKPNNSAIRHEITYKYGSKTGTLVSKSSSATTYSWTPALSLATAFPKATSGVCTITCKSYESAASNARLIGTKTLNITLTIPTSVAPTISSRTISDAMTAQYTKLGAYIQNYSKIKVVTSAAGAQGSTITSIETTIDGSKYTGSTITSAVIKKSGSISVSTKVTDSRGRTATQSSNVSFLAYAPPKISSFTAFRANSSGTANDQGTYLGTRKTWSIASLGSKNTVSVKIETRPSGGSWTTRQTLTSGYSQSNNLYTTGNIANVDLSYEVRLTVSDYFTSVQATRDVLTAAAFIHYRGDKKGIAFGKRSEKQAFEVAWPVELYGGLYLNGNEIPEIITQSGIVSIVRVANTVVDQWVDFPVPFDHVPVVVSGSNTTAPQRTIPSVTGITTEGFLLRVWSDLSGSQGIYWIASKRG